MAKEEILQHREFVQTTILRMNNNSFKLKGWNLTVVAAFLGLFAANLDSTYILIPLPVVIIFGALDAHYLQQERKFRGIYNDICDITDEREKKVMKVYDMDSGLFKNGKYSFWSCVLSPSVIPLYSVIIVSLILVYSLA